MQTLLLLAGQSKRFWPLEEKTLFPICGKTLLEHQVERLRKGGASDIVLVGGAHNLHEATKIFPKLTCIQQQDLSLGMRGALLSALPKVKKGPVMIVSGNDVIEHGAYKSLFAAAKKKGVDGVILAAKVKRYFPGGYLTLKGHRITGIVEKPGEGKEPSDLVTIVAHIHNDSAALLAELKKTETTRDDGYEVAMAALFKTHNYEAVAYKGAWQPVKYPWHVLPVLELFLKDVTKRQIDRSAQIHKTAVIDGPVIIEAGVRVLPHATIKGPCVIGKGSVIGNNALVRGSSIGENCVVGYNSEVKSSVLAANVWTHMTYLGDSVIDANVSFGGGCITGNFRLDEGEILSKVNGDNIATAHSKLGVMVGKGCRFGIHVGINPGVKIGRGTFVAGGVFLNQDVPEKSFARMKEGELVISQNKAETPGEEARKKYRK